MGDTAYNTVEGYAFQEFTERKSRFIGHISPVQTEEEALKFIAHVSKEHRAATHNVYAYRLRTGQLSRYSDNGEPQGTAGVPVLAVLQKENLVDVCVVVTRYFGGILLGTGGLVRAYSHAAFLAVSTAKVLHMAECVEIELRCDYSFYGKLTYMLPDFKAEVKGSDFGSEIRLLLLLREERFDGFSKAVVGLSNGRVIPKRIGSYFADME